MNNIYADVVFSAIELRMKDEKKLKKLHELRKIFEELENRNAELEEKINGIKFILE